MSGWTRCGEGGRLNDADAVPGGGERPHETGIEAALTILGAIVTEANALLRQLEAFTASIEAAAYDKAMQNSLDVTAGIEAHDTCGCGEPIALWEDAWYHVLSAVSTRERTVGGAHGVSGMSLTLSRSVPRDAVRVTADGVRALAGCEGVRRLGADGGG